MENRRKLKVITIDDEPEICWLITRILEEEDYLPLTADNGQDGLNLIKQEHPDIVLLDLRLPGMNGLEILKKIREFDKDLMVIILSAFESFEAAVQAMKLGSYDFLTKPLNVEEMKITLKNALRTKNLVHEVQILKQQVEQTQQANQIIGDCQPMQEVNRQLALISQYDISVLILGESGTGKEMLARAVHFNSNRSREPIICIDCSAIPENLIESELFGYEKGAFTGAAQRKIGLLETADQGTLFLDEIGNMSLSMQMKLLRVVQERTIYRLGGHSPIHINVRLIAATNQDLKQSIAKGTFREDLFYRLSEFPLKLPPLRERGDDIHLLAKYFLDKYNREFKKKVAGISPQGLAGMEDYAWPGNVRELQAAVKRGVILAADYIQPEHLLPAAGDRVQREAGALVIHTDLEEIRPIKEVSREVVAQIECQMIQRVLKKTDGNKIKAARCLGIDYKTLFNKLRQYGIKFSGGRNGIREKTIMGGVDKPDCSELFHAAEGVGKWDVSG